MFQGISLYKKFVLFSSPPVVVWIRMPPIGSGIGLLDSQLVELFGKFWRCGLLEKAGI